MKMNKEKFLKTELGSSLMAISHFYGIGYNFTRTNEYYGVVTGM